MPANHSEVSAQSMNTQSHSFAAEAILDLARADGWLAVYDPGSPSTREVNGINVATIHDGLNNLPPVSAVHVDAQPVFQAKHFGMLDGMNFGTAGAAQALRTGLLDTPLTQPTFILAVGQADPESQKAEARVMIDGQSSAGRNAMFLGGGDSSGFGIFAGYERSAESSLRGEQHLFGAQFDDLTGSQLFVDGVPQQLHDSTKGKSFTLPLNGLTIGDRALGQGRHWVGWIGPVLIYSGVPSDDARARMERLLLSYMRPSGFSVSTIASEAAVYMGRDDVLFGVDQDAPKSPASIMKILTAYVARSAITDDRLDELVTVRDSDGLTGTGTWPRLYDEDQVTWRDLFHLMMLPSHNSAARAVARVVGAEMSDHSSGSANFIESMREQAALWGWSGAEIFDPAGASTLNRMSARQVSELLMRCYADDPFLVETMGTLSYKFKVRGPKSRNMRIRHTINPISPIPLPEFMGGKTGTWANSGSVAMLVRKDSEVRTIVTMGVRPASMRYRDVRRILDGTTSESHTASVVATDIRVSKVVDLESSSTRAVLDNLYERQPSTPSQLDLTEELPEAVAVDAQATLSVQRSASVVVLSIIGVRVPARYSVAGVIPTGFRPTLNAYGVSRDRISGEVREVQVTPGGSIFFRGNSSSDTLRLTMTWMTPGD